MIRRDKLPHNFIEDIFEELKLEGMNISYLISHSISTHIFKYNNFILTLLLQNLPHFSFRFSTKGKQWFRSSQQCIWSWCHCSHRFKHDWCTSYRLVDPRNNGPSLWWNRLHRCPHWFPHRWDYLPSIRLRLLRLWLLWLRLLWLRFLGLRLWLRLFLWWAWGGNQRTRIRNWRSYPCRAGS